MHRIVIPLTIFLLASAFTLAILWLIATPDYEPVITCLTLLTALTGLFIDRWLSAREKRRQLLKSLAHELKMNMQVALDVERIASDTEDRRPKMLPRFYNSTLGTIIATGEFASKRDAKLWKQMHGWMQRSTEVNARFIMTENYVFTHPKTASMFYEVLSSGEVMGLARKSLIALSTTLFDEYARETGITRDTILFDVKDLQ